MKIKLSLLLIFFLEGSLFGQNNKVQLEFTPYIRWDKYPEFTYAINPVTSNKVNISGTSLGINSFIKFKIKSKLQIKTGLGYYKYSFNRIRQINSLFGKSNNRIIDYIPSDSIAPAIIYTTSKYFYNTIALNIGIEKQIYLAKNLQMIYDLITTNYFTFSQHYHLDYANGIEFKQTNKRYFGFSASINTGLQKSFGKMAVAPVLIISVYDVWKKDKIFPLEENNESRSKWLNSFGVGIQITYSLK